MIATVTHHLLTSPTLQSERTDGCIVIIITSGADLETIQSNTYVKRYGV